MAQRKRIALIFQVNNVWMGGVNYIINLINALNSLPEEEKPEILLLCQNKFDYEYALRYTQYPFLDYRIAFCEGIDFFIRRIINKFSRFLCKRNWTPTIRLNDEVDVVYPAKLDKLASSLPLLNWIPDFQERHLPQLFSQSDIQGRNKAILDSIQSGHPIVFSSEDALRDFRTFYDTTAEVKSYIYHFAVSIPKYNSSMREEVFKKYEIQGKFFFCANQFWVHKNHMTLFRAVKRLKEKGKNVVVYCSGGSNDYRSKDYYQSVLNYIAENHLEENIKLLGLIERNDQLCLMSESLAIIQPSLFEGWSTSVEEAKALNRYLIISDIPLHREQVVQNALFFEPKNDEELANKIAQIYDCPPKIIPYDYKEDIRKAGRTFMSIVNDLKK